MERVAILAALFLASACSGGAPGSSESQASENVDVATDVSTGGHIDDQRCGSAPPKSEFPRCIAANAVGAAATVCGALVADSALNVRSGSLVVGGDSRVAAPLHIERGSFTSFGGIEGDDTEDVDGDLKTASNWVVSAPARVEGDAFVGGRVDARNAVRVAGVLHAGGSVSSNVTAESVTNTDIDVAKSLSCDDAPDVRALATAATLSGVVDEGRALASVSERTDLTLGCGRYRFESLGIDAALSLHVDGDTVIVVDGDVRIGAPTRVTVAPGASLDIIVGGALDVENTLSFEGAPTWLGVAGSVEIASPTTLTGWLVAPSSEVTVDGPLVVNGALYVGGLRVAAPVTIDGAPPELGGCR